MTPTALITDTPLHERARAEILTPEAQAFLTELHAGIRHGAALDDGRVVTRELLSKLITEETPRMRAAVGEETWAARRPDETRGLLEALVLEDEFPEFLPLTAYELVD